MKIAILTDGIWPNVIGGMQKHSYYLCKYLAKNEIFIDLYHTSKYGNIDFSVFTEHERQFINSIFIELPKVKKFPGHYLWQSYKYSKNIYKVLEKNQVIDLIYAKGLTSWYLLKNKHNIHVPVCINIHGYEMFQATIGIISKLQQRMLRPAFSFINKKADYIFSYGSKITDIIKSLNINENKIIEIPTGIKSDWLYRENIKTNEVLKFLFVGRYEIRKGLKELSDVLKELLIESINFEFHFIGFIPDNKKIISPKIIYHGEIKDENYIMQIMRKTDVFVLPSYSEGMPNVILEAMASGCAIIATDVGAINLMVDDANGWLIIPRDTKSLKDSISRLIYLDKPSVEAKKRHSVTKVCTYFLWNEIIDKTIKHFNHLLEIESNKRIIN